MRREGKQRYKSLTTAQCQAIERDFLLYRLIASCYQALSRIAQKIILFSSRQLAVGKAVTTRREVDGGIVVDYVSERMEQPHKGRLRRQFQKGLWFQVISA